MPDDPHSRKIAAERVVMEMTGKSRSEIRNDLIDFADRRRLVQRQPINNFRPADSPKIEIRHTELPMPPPLNAENQGRDGVGDVDGVGGVDNSEPGEPTVFTVLESGTATSYAIYNAEPA